jgi:hypothetical protein
MHSKYTINSVTVIQRICAYDLLFISSFNFLLPTYSDTHYRSRALNLHLITLNDTYLLSRTPVDVVSVIRRCLYLTIHNIHMPQTSITPSGFETTFPASYRPQTPTESRAATGIGDPLFPSHYHQPQMGTRSPNIIFCRGELQSTVRLRSTVRLQSRKHLMRFSFCLHREGKERSIDLLNKRKARVPFETEGLYFTG